MNATPASACARASSPPSDDRSTARGLLGLFDALDRDGHVGHLGADLAVDLGGDVAGCP